MSWVPGPPALTTQLYSLYLEREPRCPPPHRSNHWTLFLSCTWGENPDFPQSVAGSSDKVEGSQQGREHGSVHTPSLVLPLSCLPCVPGLVLYP